MRNRKRNKLDEALALYAVNFDPAFWEYEYEGAQAKIKVYYSRNELKILWEEPFT